MRKLLAAAGVGCGCNPRYPGLKSVDRKGGGVLPLPSDNDSMTFHIDGSPSDRNCGVTLEAIENFLKKEIIIAM